MVGSGGIREAGGRHEVAPRDRESRDGCPEWWCICRVFCPPRTPGSWTQYLVGAMPLTAKPPSSHTLFLGFSFRYFLQAFAQRLENGLRHIQPQHPSATPVSPAFSVGLTRSPVG